MLLRNSQDVVHCLEDSKVSVRRQARVVDVRLSLSGIKGSDSRGWQAVKCCVTIKEGVFELRGTSSKP